MVCINCNDDKDKINKHSSDKFPICEDCVDEQITKTEQKKNKIKVTGIMLDRVEGPIKVCISRVFHDFESANLQIIENSQTASVGGGYDKHDFNVVFEDGSSYKGKFDVYHFTHEHFEYCLATHIKEHCEWVRDTDIEWVDGVMKEAARNQLDNYDLEIEKINIYRLENAVLDLVQRWNKDQEPEEEKPEMETVYVNVVDTAKLIRKDLKANFPNQKFSVRSDKYAGGASIDINWTDGIDIPSVDEIVSQYKGAHFDGMIDLQTYVSHEKDGKLYRYGSDYVSCHRDISEEMATRIANEVAELAGLEMTGIYEKAGLSDKHTGYLRWAEVAHRLSYKFNLDNYRGVQERVGCWPGNELEWELY